MTISKFRSALYILAKLLGDISAIINGRVGHRLWNRGVGKILGGVFRK